MKSTLFEQIKKEKSSGNHFAIAAFLILFTQM